MSSKTRSNADIDFQIAHEKWKQVPRLRSKIKEAAVLTLKHLPHSFHKNISLTLLLTTNAKLKSLNHDFRGINKPTNVLSFPQFLPSELKANSAPKRVREIGDIALAYQYIVDEAVKDHKQLINHIIHLVIHGLLHLFGYDHVLAKDAQKMEKLEIKIMKALGLPNPYKAETKVVTSPRK